MSRCRHRLRWLQVRFNRRTVIRKQRITLEGDLAGTTPGSSGLKLSPSSVGRSTKFLSMFIFRRLRPLCIRRQPSRIISRMRITPPIISHSLRLSSMCLASPLYLLLCRFYPTIKEPVLFDNFINNQRDRLVYFSHGYRADQTIQIAFLLLRLS